MKFLAIAGQFLPISTSALSAFERAARHDNTAEPGLPKSALQPSTPPETSKPPEDRRGADADTPTKPNECSSQRDYDLGIREGLRMAPPCPTQADDAAAREAALRRQREEQVRASEAAAAAAAAEKQRQTQAKSDYSDRIAAAVRARMIAPPGLNRDISAEIEVTQSLSGEVIATKLLKSSGEESYDAAVLRAVQSASPLPLPADRSLFKEKIKINYRSGLP